MDVKLAIKYFLHEKSTEEKKQFIADVRSVLAEAEGKTEVYIRKCRMCNLEMKEDEFHWMFEGRPWHVGCYKCWRDRIGFASVLGTKCTKCTMDIDTPINYWIHESKAYHERCSPDSKGGCWECERIIHDKLVTNELGFNFHVGCDVRHQARLKAVYESTGCHYCKEEIKPTDGVCSMGPVQWHAKCNVLVPAVTKT